MYISPIIVWHWFCESLCGCALSTTLSDQILSSLVGKCDLGRKGIESPNIYNIYGIIKLKL